MRIIAGQLRGRKLLFPPPEVTRPITDRVKQSLFDILSPEIEGAAIFDCFSGAGSLGLECLSRGAVHATFFESNAQALDLLRKNIAALGLARRSATVQQDIFSYFAKREPPPASARPAAALPRLCFLDPPYEFIRNRADDLRALAQRIAPWMAPAGLFILRRDAKDALELPPFSKVDSRDYGSMSIDFWRIPLAAAG